MRIGLVGYGKMGKAIERIALERGHEISFISNSSNPFPEQTDVIADVLIEFTQPSLAVKNIVHAIELKLPIVVGTTAWYEQFDEVKSLVEKNNGSLLYATNFSVGVNILFKVNQYLSKLMENRTDYNVSLEEIHHTQKLDAPSGTAVSIAEGIVATNDRYKNWKCEVGNFPEAQLHEIPIAAIREPNVPGTHEIFWKSAIDTISLKHEAHSRDGFALGSVLAAEFLYNKKGIFTMQDVLAI